jgi:hypothetical protein
MDLSDYTGTIRLKDRTLTVENGETASVGANGRAWGLTIENGIVVGPPGEKPCTSNIRIPSASSGPTG